MLQTFEMGNSRAQYSVRTSRNGPIYKSKSHDSLVQAKPRLMFRATLSIYVYFIYDLNADKTRDTINKDIRKIFLIEIYRSDRSLYI